LQQQQQHQQHTFPLHDSFLQQQHSNIVVQLVVVGFLFFVGMKKERTEV